MPEFKTTKVEVEVPVEFGGTFECHTCLDWVWEAKYYPKQELLKWTCPAGHTSEIEYIYG